MKPRHYYIINIQKKSEEDYYAADGSVTASLSKMAKHRTDIFGVEEYDVGVTSNKDQKKLATGGQWDGHASTAGQAQYRQHVTDEQRAQERRDQYNKGIMPGEVLNPFRTPLSDIINDHTYISYV